MKRYRQGGAGLRHTENRAKYRTQHSEWSHKLLSGVRVFVLVILQVSLIPRFSVFGAVPDILLPFLLTLAVTGSSVNRTYTVAITGIAAGFLADALGSTGLGLLTLFYFLIGTLISSTSRGGTHGILEDLARFYAVFVPALLLRGGVTVASILLAGHGFDFSVCLTSILIPAWISTLLLSLPVFLIFRGRD